jgi:hypothetical protein
MKAVTTAIFTKFGGSSLDTAIGGRLYKGAAPDGAEFPYAVYGLVSDIPDNVFAKHGEEARFQFDLFSSASSSGEVEDLYTYLKALYDDCALTITSQTHICMKRELAFLSVEDYTTTAGTQKVFHYVVDYMILTEFT